MSEEIMPEETITRVVDVWLLGDNSNRQIETATDCAIEDGLELSAAVPIVTFHGRDTTTSYIKLIFTLRV